MMLPRDHKCDISCDPEDDEHRSLRKRRKVQVRAGFMADQAWAKAREAIPALMMVRNKLRGQAPLIQDDVDVIDMAIALVLGELHLRQSETY